MPRADNPIVQTVYTADPAPLVHQGRVYVYTGHDEDGSTYFTMRDWRVFSSADMVNWTDHGSPLGLSTFSWASQDAWAGQSIYRNGKFYWYVPVRASNGAQHIGVAVSDSPTGPFTDSLGRPLVSNAEIDPTVFIDDSGQAYLYYGNPNLWYVRLNADMISYSGTPQRVTLTTQSFGVRRDTARPTSYEEAPWLFKRNSLYYMMFAGGPISEHIAYSTGPSATGPWTYRGVIMPTQGGSFTNHAGIVDFAGNSYFFYHNGALPGGGGFTRSVSVERFSYNADGTIPTINMTTGGPAAVANLNPYTTVEAETIAWEVGVETERCSEGGMDVSNISNGDYIKVKSVDFGTGATSFQARVASATSGGSIQLRLGGTTGTLVGTCAVSGTGGWQTWTTVNCNVSGATGVKDLFLVFTGGSGNLFNVNWWKFVGGSATTYALDVTRGGNGTGTVTSTPAGISCGTTCSASYASGTTVTLTATAASGSTFAGWSGACTGTSATCTASMTAARTVTATFNANVIGGPISINAGGAASGTFVADTNFSGGSTYSVTTAIDTSLLSGTVPAQAVLQSERYGEFSYTIPGFTAGSAQTVTLYFAEVYWTAAGQRTFNVAINGNAVLTAFDIFAAAGGAGKAISRTFNTTANSSGQVVIQFTKGGGPDNPKVCAITVATGTGTSYTLTVNKAGAGSGTVSGPSISCGATCGASYASGTAVTLTAAAASGSTFAGWSGACTGTGTCTVTMTAAQMVTATFDASPDAQTLTVTKAGTGSGTVTGASINCGTTCSATYASGTAVTLTAAAASGSTFAGWSGACTGTGTCTVSMTAARTVTATFDASPDVQTLTVTKAGTGSGTVTGASISCGTTCSASYASGTTVTLTAAAASGSTFAGWSGACTGTGTCTVSMTAARTVTATFNTSPTNTCKTPVANGQSGNFDTTGAVCYTVSSTVNGWGCSNVDGRTVTVNGTAVTCGQMPLPGSAPYTFSFTAGSYPWASFYWW